MYDIIITVTNERKRNMYTLYGNGINDDTNAIQEMIDSGACEVSLPAPEVCYLISRPLEVPSNFRLILPRFATIKLAKGSNCLMLKNKTRKVSSYEDNPDIWAYNDGFDNEEVSKNIEIRGGIWDFNNLEQDPNPILCTEYAKNGYTGFGFLFYNVKNLILSSMTLKDPTTFAVTIDKTSYFTVDNIVFDFNYGNPLATNMDGIHVCGNSHFGRITNLQGACYDDLVALNADEGSDGPITHVDISGIYAEDCHSAVRLLACKQPVEHVHISDVHGTYFQYCVGLTRFFPFEHTGYLDAITIDNIYASKAKRLPVYNKPEDDYVYAVIFIEPEQYVKNLKVSDVHRREFEVPIETVLVGWKARVDNLILENITTENHMNAPRVPVYNNQGTVYNLTASNIFEDGRPVEISTQTVGYNSL